MKAITQKELDAGMDFLNQKHEFMNMVFLGLNLIIEANAPYPVINAQTKLLLSIMQEVTDFGEGFLEATKMIPGHEERSRHFREAQKAHEHIKSTLYEIDPSLK